MSDCHHTQAQINEVKSKVLDALAESAAQVAPQFFENMPADYFRSVSVETQLSHLKALIATKVSGFSQDILLRSEDRKLFTFIIDKSYPGQLSELLQRLPHGHPLHTAKVFTARDSSLILDIFHFGELAKFDPQNEQDRKKKAELLNFANRVLDSKKIHDFEKHIHQCSQQYLHTVRPERLLQHYLIASRIRGSNDTIVEIENKKAHIAEITIGIGLPNRRAMFERISRHFGKKGVDIHRAHLESFKGANGESVALLGFQVSCNDPLLITRDSTGWENLKQELTRIYYLDQEVLEIAYSDSGLSLLESELFVAFAHLAHQLLVKIDRLAYSREQIKSILLKNIEVTRKIISAFIKRFSVRQSASAEPENESHDDISQHLYAAEAKRIIAAVAKIPQTTLATNLFLSSRYALSMSLIPSYLATNDREKMPYGLFFVFGRNFDGFHVRFQDIARGGVRIVRTKNPEIYAYETERHYDEAYGLAFAQQLKNKDIPEGGSKGVILTKPSANREFCGRAFADALLDLISPAQSNGNGFVDYRKKQELLYLGPDENVTNGLITWIVERAHKRNYPLPRSFMSSKPGAGINHKEYGVTSEGVIVFLETALKEIGLDPWQEKFSLKLTGGPDGDVAGNCIRVLFGEFPDTIQIVGIADGSGYAEDPNGLDKTELLRLVEYSLPNSGFDRSKLGTAGVAREAIDLASIQLRNNLHNRVVSDAFIPAGGRPRTINQENWSEFLIDDSPSSRVVVEGANLFITPEARRKLSARNILIVRDSSANKCGVICSSFEIAASMLLSEDEFLEIKHDFVNEVILKLRDLAALEAKLLMVEKRHHLNVILPDLSKRISEVIERSARAVAEIADDLPPATITELISTYLPTTLVMKVGTAGISTLPKQYTTNLIAASLASLIVYREGLGYFEEMNGSDISKYARRYLKEEAFTNTLVEEVLTSTLSNKDRIAYLLKQGATRIAIEE
jgi:glutamate dehydrogenase